MSTTASPWLTPALRTGLELGPLGVYLAFLGFFGLTQAILFLMIVTPFTVGILWYGERKVPWMPLITAIFLLLFGGVSILSGEVWILKIKPTILNVLIAGALGISTLLGLNFLKSLLGSQIRATDEQWRRMTFNFVIFFLVSAFLNLAAWVGFDMLFTPGETLMEKILSGSDVSDRWWGFVSKIGLVALSFAFTIWQFFPFISQMAQEAEAEGTSKTDEA